MNARNNLLAAYPGVLGDELRQTRKARGWTRKDLQAHLESEISLPALAAYELGTRTLSVVKLVELCAALGTSAPELLGRVHARLSPGPSGTIDVDLRTLATHARPELEPVRGLAARQVRDLPGDRPSVVALHPAAIQYLAQLCDLPASELVTALVS
ncbi:MAG TPA: helix-turn-helix transcriptional regulator [Pseudonocardiaceae bacterium]|nr:helix-turn-helix transcriptional regulator [Pseudonocardiaceae bacterium]